MQYLDSISKTTEWSLFISKANHSNITVIQAYAPTSNAEEAEVEQFYDDLQDLLELTQKKRHHFHHRGLECKKRKLRDTCSNRQVWPWSTKWSRAKANRVLPRECTGHNKHSLPTTQEETLHMDITRWSTPKSDWLWNCVAFNIILYSSNFLKFKKKSPIRETHARNFWWDSY